MKFTLKKISGVDDAILSLKFTRRTYTPEIDDDIRDRVFLFSGPEGFISENECATVDPDIRQEEYQMLLSDLEKVANYGAGVGDAYIDAGHETILRFIDFSVVVEGLHRGAQDDLDAHAMRMNNRIIRASSRIPAAPSAGFNARELSDWYKDKIVQYSELNHPVDCIKDGVVYRNVGVGYVREDFLINNDSEIQDVIRGLYPLGQTSSCIFKISLHDLRHIYKRRNAFTHAAPELKLGIEQLADQVEKHLPVLGKLIRNDYCDDGQLHHIMDIVKHYDPEKARSKNNDE